MYTAKWLNLTLFTQDRGRPNEEQRQLIPASYGSFQAAEFLDGAEILTVKERVEEESDEEEKKEKDWIDGEWKDVEHKPEDDLDEEAIKNRMEKEEEREGKISREELIRRKNEKAKDVVTSRILTSEEHRKIKEEQTLKRVVDIRRSVRIEDKMQSQNSSNLGQLLTVSVHKEIKWA